MEWLDLISPAPPLTCCVSPSSCQEVILSIWNFVPLDLKEKLWTLALRISLAASWGPKLQLHLQEKNAELGQGPEWGLCSSEDQADLGGRKEATSHMGLFPGPEIEWSLPGCILKLFETNDVPSFLPFSLWTRSVCNCYSMPVPS